MVSAATQAKVEADNARLEGAVRVVMDEIDKVLMRPVAKKGLQCALKCYDTLAQHGTSDALQQCVQNCEQPHQKANAIVRQVRESSIRGHDAYRTMEFFQIRIGSAFACICFERVSTYRPSLIQRYMIFNASLYAGNRTISKPIGTCHP